jgi:hypothetical protein
MLFSFDNQIIINKINEDGITIKDKLSKPLILNRLIRYLNSSDLSTKIWVSEILWLFIEENGEDIDFNFLLNSVNQLITYISQENNYQIGRNIGEAIFEFLWLEKLDKNKENEILITLANLNKDFLFAYLDNEDYMELNEVRLFIERMNLKNNN